MSCSSLAPIAVDDASVVRARGAVADGYARRVMLASCFLQSLNAFSASLVQEIFYLYFFMDCRR